MLGKCQMQTQAFVHQRELLHLRTASTADTLLIDKISIASANCPQSVSKIDSSKRFFKKVPYPRGLEEPSQTKPKTLNPKLGD